MTAPFPPSNTRSEDMKPVVTMEKPAETTVANLPPVINQPVVTRKRFIWGFVAGVVLAVVVAGLTITAVYVGGKLAKDQYKEYHATVKDEKGDTTTEKIVVTKTEEDYRTDQVRTIYDFRTGLAVYVFPEGNPQSEHCYVASFNMTDMKDPKTFLEEQRQSEITMDPSKIQNFGYSVTSIELNNNVLGPRGREACAGKKVLMLQETDPDTEKDRQKRAICWRIYRIYFYWGYRYIIIYYRC